MFQLAVTLVLALLSPTVIDRGAGVVEYRRAPLARLLSLESLELVLPREVARSSSLLVDARGEATAVVSECSIVGPLRQIHEREIVFREGGMRLIQTEEVRGSERRLVWRELRPHGARTWTATWGRSGAKVTGYGWRREVHEALRGFDPSDPPIGPLELAHRLRTGARVPGGSVSVVDAAAASVARATVRCEARGTTLRRPDGTLLLGLAEGCVWFHDGAGESLALNDVEAGRRRSRWLVESRPAHEAMLALIRGER